MPIYEYERRLKLKAAEAHSLIGVLECAQHISRVHLKSLDPTNPQYQRVKGEMMQRRLGQKGLRALNKRLHGRSWRS